MKNLKLLIIILILFAICIIGVLVVLNIQGDRLTQNNIVLNSLQYSNMYDNYIYNEPQIELNNTVGEIETPEEPEQKYTDLELMKIYLEDFSIKALNDIEQAYKLLDEEYREKRFGTLENFRKYVQEKQIQLANIELRQYAAEEDSNTVIYKGTDENGNYYYIRETDYMEYTIMLDNYTLADYSDLDDKEIIKNQVEKFILMINSADYTNAYNLLEPTFKQAYFPTEQDFINYIKNNWFERNIIAKREVKEDRICVVTMREKIATTSKKIEKEFKINLGEEIDFTIEFNI